MIRRRSLLHASTLVSLSILSLLASHARAQAQAVTGAPAMPATPLAAATAEAEATDYAKAEADLAAIKGTDRPAAQLVLARVRLEQGKFADAEKAAQAASADPKSKGFATALRAEILLTTGKVSEAEKLLDGAKSTAGAAGVRIKLLLGEARIRLGRRADADEPLMAIVQEYNDGTITSQDGAGLAIVGRAAHLLRSPKDANTAFNESERAAPKRPETLAWRADLFLDKYDPGHAEETLRDALSVSPHRPDLLVSMARVKLEEALDFEAAEKLIAEALTVNPKATGAFAVRAGISLRDMNLKATDASIDQGLAIDPNDLELLSLRAATRFLADDSAGYDAAKRAVFAKNSEYSRFYSIVGELAEWEHRYNDIVSMMKEATHVDAEDSKAWADLGLTEMRNADETAGLEALRTAWSKDHFNVRVFNTLNLYEQTIPNLYVMEDAGVFKLRYPKAEAPILRRYVPKLLNEAWAGMKARYSFLPTTPVQVEMYGTREQFSVRTSGLPNIGIQGVCFGKVVAAMSPASEPFNWGNVVWHELGHVFAIQLSKNHVPRWFTEGLSEYETIARRPEWQRELDPELYMAITNNRLPTAVDMNQAFTHATDEGDVTTAYYASSQMLVFTVETFGMPKVVLALKAWGQGLRTPEVIERAFGVTPEVYDAQYRTWQLQKLQRYKRQFMFSERPPSMDAAKAKVLLTPNDAQAHVDLGFALLAAHQAKEARAEIQQALKLDPVLPTAHYFAAKLAEADGDLDGAITHVQAMRGVQADGYQVEELAAELATKKKDKVGAKAAWEAVAKFDPTQVEAFRALAVMADEEHRDSDVITYLQKAAMLDQHDRVVWRKLLEKLVAAKRWDEARTTGDAAIYVDVESAPIHTMYGRALAAGGQHDKALYEAESATLCTAPPPEAAAAQAFFASELAIAKRTADAKVHRDNALKLDPTNAEAKALNL